MTYLLNLNGNFYYNREVPAIYRDLDPRGKVRRALGTKNKREAIRKAIMLDDQVEAYWKSLVSESQQHDAERFGKIVHTTRQMGFTYIPMQQVISLPTPELVDRVNAIEEAPKQQVEAALGAKEEPGLMLSAGLEQYWRLTKHKLLDKSEHQVRKWRNPRIKAVRNFIELVGDKELKLINVDDMLQFRDWWIDRINEEELKPKSANKDFIHLKQILQTVSKHFKLGLDLNHLFEDVMLPEDSGRSRLPFTSEQIIELLHHPLLNEIEEDAKWLIWAMAETGARNTEIIGLLTEDIRLDAEIPHIAITARKGHKLKTKHCERTIPLVGYALDAFKERPNGFPAYRDYSDILTNKVNKFLRENNLFPSTKHSLYSLRHSFQDRLVKAKAIDKVQVQLMGHRFKDREDYGLGADLQDKLDYMEVICLKTMVA